MRSRRYCQPGVKVVFLADRGFADTELLAQLRRLGWHFRIRIKATFSVLRPGQPRLQSRRFRAGSRTGAVPAQRSDYGRAVRSGLVGLGPPQQVPGSIGILSVMNPPACTPSWSTGGALILKRTSWTINPTAFSSKVRSCAMPTPSPGSVWSWRSPRSIWWRKARRWWPRRNAAGWIRTGCGGIRTCGSAGSGSKPRWRAAGSCLPRCT